MEAICSFSRRPRYMYWSVVSTKKQSNHNRPPSMVGIAMGSIDVGAAAGDVLADRASIQNVEP